MSDFEKAAAAFEELVKAGKPNRTEMLQAYKYYKQGSGADFSQAKQPYTLDLSGSAKYNAWKEVKDVSVEEAQKAYIEFVAEMQEKYA